MSFYFEKTNNNVITFSCDCIVAYPHIHTLVELLYVKQGTLKVMVDNTDFTLHEGQGMIISPNIVHSYYNSSNVVVLYMFSPDFIYDFLTVFAQHQINVSMLSYSSLSEYSKLALDQLINISNKGDCNTPTMKGFLTILLADVFNEAGPLPVNGRNDYEICQAALLYIDNHIKEALSLTNVSRALGVSSHYLSLVFSTKLKIGFCKYISDRRLDIAKSLLSNTLMSITEISYEAGFSSIRTFNRRFKEAYDISPREWHRYHARL